MLSRRKLWNLIKFDILLSYDKNNKTFGGQQQSDWLDQNRKGKRASNKEIIVTPTSRHAM